MCRGWCARGKWTEASIIITVVFSLFALVPCIALGVYVAAAVGGGEGFVAGFTASVATYAVSCGLVAWCSKVGCSKPDDQDSRAKYAAFP